MIKEEIKPLFNFAFVKNELAENLLFAYCFMFYGPLIIILVVYKYFDGAFDRPQEPLATVSYRKRPKRTCVEVDWKREGF